MAYCRKCGKMLADNANHCTVCGAPVLIQQNKTDTGRIPTVGHAAPAQQPQGYRSYQPPQSHQPSQPSQSPRPPKKKKNTTLILLYILLGVLVMSLLGIGAWALLGRDGGKKSDPHLGRYDAVSCTADGEAVAVNGEYVILRAKGKAVLYLQQEQDATWELRDEELTLTTEDQEYEGTLEGDRLTLEAEGKTYVFEKGQPKADEPGEILRPTETTRPRDQDRSWWEGDWYGWWTVLEGTGEFYMMEQAAWDVCARIEPGEADACSLHIWDEHRDNPFVWFLDGTISDGDDERGVLTVREGTFRGADLGGTLSADPAALPYGAYPDLLYITGTYVDPQDPENTCTYSIVLRPWGTQWEDLRTGDTSGMPYPNMLPIGYDSWYLPLIREGEPMPNAFN